MPVQKVKLKSGVQLDAFADDGAVLRDEGIERAARGADNASPDWTHKAYGMLADFVRMRGPSWPAFSSEDVRRYATARGLPAPPELRAWGGVFQKAARAGLIVPAGFRKSANAQAHKRPVQHWHRKP